MTAVDGRQIILQDANRTLISAEMWGNDCAACEGNVTPGSAWCDSCGEPGEPLWVLTAHVNPTNPNPASPNAALIDRARRMSKAETVDPGDLL